MADPEGIIAIFSVFFTPVFIVGIVSLARYKTKQLEAKRKDDPKQLEKEREERKQLEARVQNLESIVCSVDLELNARMNRMLAAQSAVGALPPHVADPKSDPKALGPTVATPQPRGSVLAMALTPGQKIADRYTIERELGRGGMGAVYRAADGKLAERVALKIINAGYGDPAAIDRFRREVAAARKVTHPNVIRIHDLVEDGGMVLLSMEYVDGMTLAEYLGRIGALRVDEARHIVGQVCDGVAAAHSAGIVHRDLKPANVLLDHEKRVKVIDFGLAKATFMAGMTATGLIIGTPEYMAPEQVKGLPQDARTDVYALGALAYHMFVGRPPFSGETPIAIGFQHVTETPRAPRELRADVPDSVEKAILTALDKDPGKRYADAAEFKKALLS